MEIMCRPTTFRIEFKEKYDHINENNQFDYYDISHINYLIEILNYYGIETIDGIHYINASVLDESYEYTQKPWNVEWDPESNILFVK
jgi:hypothetical protein